MNAWVRRAAHAGPRPSGAYTGATPAEPCPSAVPKEGMTRDRLAAASVGPSFGTATKGAGHPRRTAAISGGFGPGVTLQASSATAASLSTGDGSPASSVVSDLITGGFGTFIV